MSARSRSPGADVPAPDEAPRPVLPAAEGRGALLQRDYWAVVASPVLGAGEVGALLAERFCDFPPESLVRFRRVDGGEGPLEVGDELEVEIRMAGTHGVRVLHRDARSLTLGTLEGHPEAGRITFGAYPNDRGDLVVHIRSRARSDSRPHLLGFRVAGEAMQTTTWGDFLDRLAATVGEGVQGVIHADTVEVEDAPEDGDPEAPGPTFVARGG